MALAHPLTAGAVEQLVFVAGPAVVVAITVAPPDLYTDLYESSY